jgi:saccharopine dehydrogenase-like NADP-dependent oxidoreductase
MNIVIFGASGMVGQGVLPECLRDTGLEHVLVIGRSSAGCQHAKLREVIVKDLFDVA